MILCCGEALIDMIPVPTVGGAEGFVPHAGGAIFNTAIALGRLGVPTGFMTGLSTDLFGATLMNALEESAVDASFSIRSDLPTTLAFVKLTNGQAQYTFYDENTAGRSLTPDDIPNLPQDIEALYFGGISLISEPCAEFYAALAERESKTQTIVLDPNIRPGFIGDESVYRSRLNRMIAVCDILKVSDEDLDWIIPGPEATEQKALSLRVGATKVVIVTRGEAGATVWADQNTSVSVAANRVRVVDTVGAGDTFNAGVLAYLQKNVLIRKENLADITSDALAAALSLGAAVAAVTVSRAGANPPWQHELDDASEA
ncbi:MAG: carbohydrate kinase [Pseudomonadota bacterium]